MKIDPLGNILLDMEVILDKMVSDHGLQTGDILALVYQHLQVHHPEAFEEYTEDNSNPEFYYGPRRK